MTTMKHEYELFHKVFDYLPSTGCLVWKLPTGNRVRVGQEAGAVDSNGRKNVIVLGKQFPVSHVCWCMFHGVMPKNQVDHINGIKTDNRIDNLREATNQQNSWNRRHRRKRLKGVSFHKRSGKFHARIMKSGERFFLGEFDSSIDAAIAYDNKAKELFGDFALINGGDHGENS